MALFQTYSLTDIIIFAILLALAIKGFISFIDWVRVRIKQSTDKEYLKLNEKKQLEQKIQHNSQVINTLKENQQSTNNTLEKIITKISTLIQSDRDDIKAYITRQHHHFCYEIGWIDDFSLSCIQKRYSHYKKEGGNSFIDSFMEDLRALPKQQQNSTTGSQQQPPQ